VLGTLCPCFIAELCNISVDEHDFNEAEHCECKPASPFTFDVNALDESAPIATHFESQLISSLDTSETICVQHYHSVPHFLAGPALFVKHCTLLI